MKRILIILLFVSTSAAAQVKPKAEIAYMPSGYNLQSFYHDHRFGDFRSRIGIDFVWKGITLSFDNHVYMERAGPKFAPTRTDYIVQASCRLTDKIKIKAEHMCIHPVINNRFPTQDITGGYTSFGISYGY